MSERTQTLVGEQYLVTHSVGQNQSGIRLDRFLMQRYRRRSREQLKKAIDSGAITVNRQGSKHLHSGRIKPSFALHGGDIVEVLSIKRPEPPVCFDYKILYEDTEILVLHKPPNLPVHPAGRFFFNTLLVHLKTNGFTSDVENERMFYPVHRIDKETSGVLLFAKTREACHALTTQFKNRETEKYYLAIGRGAPSTEDFTIDASIGKKPGGKIGLKIYAVPEEQGGQTALTRFETVESRTDASGNTYSLLACFPKTGRQHQIRVHAEIAGVPLVGDKIYGMNDDEVLALLDGHLDYERSKMSQDLVNEEDLTEESPIHANEEDFFASAASAEDDDLFKISNLSAYAEISSRLLLPRHALHAAGLKFKHPTTGKEMVFETSLPDDLREFFEGLTGFPLQPFKTKHW